MKRFFQRLPHNRAKGAAGEDRAVRWLIQRGYRVVARNLRNAGGELDLVATHGDTLCFVEIKARASDRFGPAILAVDRAKRAKLARAAAAYLAAHPWEGPCRFDVLGIDLAGGAPRFTLLENAFEVGE